MRYKRVKEFLLLWIPIALWLTFVLFPYVWMFLTSLKEPSELYTSPIQYLPKKPTFAGYKLLMETTKFPQFILNSLWWWAEHCWLPEPFPPPRPTVSRGLISGVRVSCSACSWSRRCSPLCFWSFPFS